jgi:hypothetical protein
LGFADFKERPASGVQKLALVVKQGRHPIRIVLIETPGKFEKFIHLPGRLDRPHLDVIAKAHGLCPRERPGE